MKKKYNFQDKKFINLVFNRKKTEEQFRIMAGCCEKLINHLSVYQTAGNSNYPYLSDVLQEMLIDTELSFRILAKEHVDLWNNANDLGMVEYALEQIVHSQADLRKEFKPALEKAHMVLKDNFPNVDLEFMNQIPNLLKDMKFSVSSEKNHIKVSNISGDEKQEFFIDPQPRVGQMGRVDSSQLFQPNKFKGATMVRPTIDMCDSRKNENNINKILDPYQAMVQGISFSKNWLYKNRRLFSEFRPSRFTGNEPVILIIGFIIALALFLAGTVINLGCAAEWWSGDFCDWVGWLLLGLAVIIGGVTCVLGGCALIFGTAVSVRA